MCILLCWTDPDCVQTQIEEESWTEKSKSSLSPFLEQLWVFKCELTKGRNVSCMTWNKKNPVLSVLPILVQSVTNCFIKPSLNDVWFTAGSSCCGIWTAWFQRSETWTCVLLVFEEPHGILHTLELRRLSDLASATVFIKYFIYTDASRFVHLNIVFIYSGHKNNMWACKRFPVCMP